MSEEQIIKAIAYACEDRKLRFQIIIQDTTLHVYINRPTQASLDYPTLKQKIFATIADLYPAQFRQICLYCRVLGKIEPDWESALELEASNLASAEMSSMMEAIADVVDNTDSIVSKIEQELIVAESFMYDPQIEFEDLPTTAEDDQFAIKEAELSALLEDSIEELDLSKYCFIRNRRLLYAVLDPPWSNIAHLIETFDRFDMGTKRSQLPVLEVYFENLVTPDLDTLEQETQIWWRKVMGLDSDNRHKLAIWLSRYCLNAAQTMISIKEVFQAQTVTNQTNYSLSPTIKSNSSSLPPNQDRQPVDESNFESKSSSWFRPVQTLLNNLRQIFRPLK